MGDCFWFGLKRQKIDHMKAKEFYYKASNLKQPEAMCALSILFYDLIMSDDFWRDNYGRSLDPIPKDKIEKINENSYKGMWDELLGVATLNYISPYLIFQADQAEQLNIWPLSKLTSQKIKLVKFVIKKHKAGQTIEFERFRSSIKVCDNCNIYMNVFEIDLVEIYPCVICLNKRYCSKICKDFDFLLQFL